MSIEWQVAEGSRTLHAIDTAKAASAASGLPLVSVPTTYSGAEWTRFFGVRDPDRRLMLPLLDQLMLEIELEKVGEIR